MVTPEQKRETVDYAIAAHNLPPARACRIFGYSRSNLYYIKKMPAKDEVIKTLIVSELKYNDGRMKVTKKIQNKHKEVSSSRIRRVYTLHGFSLYKRIKSRRIKRKAVPIEVPLQANIEWAIDFMIDALSNGRRIRTLNIIEQYNRKCLGIHCAHSITAKIVTKTLDNIIQEQGKPQRIRTDNGPEFTSKHFQLWLAHHNIQWVAIAPGHPEQNALIERFNRSYREAVLDANLFRTLQEAQDISNTWLHYYNNERPHQSLNNQTPNDYAA